MINTKELDKLEEYLEKNNYNYERLKVFSGEQIKVFDAKNTVSWDVVIHEYSWGHKDGLLEIMSGDNHMVDHNSHEDGVEGFLDADTIINRLESIGQNPTYEDIGVDIKTTNPTNTPTDIISRQAAISALQKIDGCTDLGTDDLFLSMGMAVKRVLSLPPVEPKIYGNEHNCIMTLFGECSYSETGCGDCAVVEKVRDALKGECPPVEPRRPKGEWIDRQEGTFCSECDYKTNEYHNFCPNCGCDCRGDKE